MPAARSGEIADRIVPSYVAGLATEGTTGQDDATRDAFVRAALVRSERVALCGFLADQYLAVHPG